ncbi:hypothetical protein C8R45DRAFT_849903 [Mycena sanguinolenta]|nr:hypothetical protein C8R45DRAFT_849903 [Mycena sanguinolenta]
MPGRVVQSQVKLAAMNLFERDIMPLADILEIVGFSESTFWRTRKLWRDTGWVEKPKSTNTGRQRILIREDLDYILSLVNLRPDWFLNELLKLVQHNRHISVHFTTIFRELEHLGMSRKKLKKIGKERNEDVRLDFVCRMAEYRAEQIGCLDETSKNDRTYSRGYGIGLLSIDGMVANRVVEGSMKRDDYLDFVEHEVVCTYISISFLRTYCLYLMGST